MTSDRASATASGGALRGAFQSLGDAALAQYARALEVLKRGR